MSGAATRRAVADRVATWIVLTAVCCWSAQYGALGPLFVRSVSACAGPRFRCTVVPLGVVPR